ncbi:SMP-30/Gluconolaconase/LRE-like region family protein [Mycobacterium kansasii]|uniref:SMP-30/Gluconolaconase/LRE-like region family protein n=1 Tax=Mycobacterium kansasii TaxID=1768 RepID=A0A1V3WDC4_MYCKA|nr:SMP-30/Gluconolaconase/LRE-like region family protein [Mycobacterium kansasii]
MCRCRFADIGDGLFVEPAAHRAAHDPARAARRVSAGFPGAGGVIRPLSGHPQAALYDNGARRLVVLTPDADPSAPSGITVFDDAQTPSRVITLPGPATALTCDDHGTAYLAARGGYLVVDLSAGRIAQVSVADAAGTDFTAIARRADGKLVLGSADGAVYILDSESSGTARTANRIKIFARVDSLVTQGNTTVVLDRGQTSVTTIGADGRARQALRAGEGATTLAADPLGRVLVADTRGGQLLVYGVDPLILRQAYPVPQAPYGLAGSRELAWVSQTASNVVIGYDLSTGIPVEKVRYPTVQQPNSLAFDDASGTLYVVSGSGAGVQVIEHAAGIA